MLLFDFVRNSTLLCTKYYILMGKTNVIESKIFSIESLLITLKRDAILVRTMGLKNYKKR
jgi:hypothetical protein